MTESKYKIIVEWFLNGDVGLSSKALCGHMLGINVRFECPYDSSDRFRCIKLLRLMPEWLDRLDEMKKYTGWSDQVELVRKEFYI